MGKQTKAASADGARRRRIQPMLDYWVHQLRITDWDISWMFAEPKVLMAGDGRAIAQITFNQPYHKAFLRFDWEMVDGCSEAELERVVIHELCHILNYSYRAVYHDYAATPLGQELLGADETVADILAGIFFHYRYPAATLAPFEPLVHNDQGCQECHPESESEDGTD